MPETPDNRDRPPKKTLGLTEEERILRDRENAKMRLQISLRMQREWNHCQILALRKLGPGWEPSSKISVFRVEDQGPMGKDDPPRVPVAVAYKVRRGKGEARMDRYLREKETGEILVSENYENVFEGLLEEKHPSLTIEIRGQQIPRKRYQPYWSALERYEPLSADQLASLRQSRRRKKAEREQQRWKQENPLLAWVEKNLPREEEEEEEPPAEPRVQSDPPAPDEEPRPLVQRDLFSAE